MASNGNCYTVAPLLLVLMLTVGSAGTSAAEPITLEDLVFSALEQNREVQNARLELAEARALMEQARAGRSWRGDLLLDVDRVKTPSYMETLYSFAGEEVHESYSTYSGTLALSTVIWDAIENKAMLKKAQLAKEESKNSLRQVQYSVVEDTLKAVFALFQARDGVELAQKAREQREQTLDRVIKEKEAGQAVAMDVKEAEMELEQACSVLERAENYRELTEKRVMQVTGLDREIIDRIAQPSLPNLDELEDANPWPWGLEQMQEIALENRPEIAKSKLGEELAQIELEEARSSRFQLNLGGSYTSHENNIRAGLDMSSDYRLTGTLTYFDTTLPDVEEVQIDEEEWEEFKDSFIWDEQPDWFPEREDVEEFLSVETEEEDEWEVRAGLQINLFDSGLRSAAIKEKQSSLQRMENIYKEAQEGIQLEIQALFTALEEKYNDLHNAEMEYLFAQQRYQEVRIMVEEEMATREEKELAYLGKIRGGKELLEKYYDYELAKVELGAALGLDVDMFLATLTVD